MINLVILLILVIGFFVGLKRGFILQLIHITGFIIAFIIAYMYFKDLAPHLKLWIPYPALDDNNSIAMLLKGMNLETAYYRAIAFAIIFFAVKIILHIIGSALDFVARLPIIKPLNIWAGGILGFVEVYLIIFILLYIAALLPIDSIQTSLDQSFIAKGIIKNTPFLSKQIEEWWITNIS
ncbi:CvpA family protein [Heyndrickxia sp. FSL K6-6286]|uniref:CvpA family protein n=1 Tax=Heyndrickxia oleronia TaxID=38875 RepID=A0AAW6SQC1_9BACI|nr:CvpA family protein [Heyndrickxia oleronia]MCM3237208.1 CvpA family protein [Heyndrickxia oleronia]MDH5160408.1 CvpA family protein [Heyndrickxia oleronia]GIN38707.1 membrane protein [Heyndrickxia oleronia]